MCNSVKQDGDASFWARLCMPRYQISVFSAATRLG